MDPITTAIVAALTVGATSGITDTAKTMITDTYQRLKSLLHNKFGRESNQASQVRPAPPV